MLMDRKYNVCAVVKIGGSVITTEDGKVDFDVLRFIAQELIEFKNEYNENILVVHGGGSVGKIVFRTHGIESDFLTSLQKTIIREFRTAVKLLNESVVKVFSSAGVQCIAASANELMKSRDGDIVSCDFSWIVNQFEQKLTPVIYSDVLVDVKKGHYACSSDQITSFLSRQMKPEKAVFLTDVDGVYENFPPENASQKPIPVVNWDFLRHLQPDYTVGHGDMRGKVLQALHCASSVELCCIVNGRVRGNLINALKGNVQYGTTIISEE